MTCEKDQRPLEWSPTSWTTRPVLQDVKYDDRDELDRVLEKLRHLPPLVHPGEVAELREQLARVAMGKAFLLQGGDCAELFEYCSQQPIEDKLKVLLQMSLVLIWGARIPVVRIARMAGQYAKPRSKPTEIIDGKEVLSYRGDNINGFDPADRKSDPQRLLGAYFHSATTLNYVRALLSAGFADLHHPSDWDLGHVRSTATKQEYATIVSRLGDALDFMKTIGADTGHEAQILSSVDLFMSHEGLHLEYESALTRQMPSSASGGDAAWYNIGTHFLWIGDRTRELGGAHVEYFSGIENPVGIKCGPTMRAEDLGPLLDKLNPKKEIGKCTLITRYGVNNVEKYLPGHIAAVERSGHVIVWACDPMHGNTETAKSGLKTRDFQNIVAELTKTLEIHDRCGSHLGGVHFELTGDSVTECLGGSMDLRDADLSLNYQTHCDPRLNYEQSLDMAFLISKHYEKARRAKSGPTAGRAKEFVLRG